MSKAASKPALICSKLQGQLQPSACQPSRSTLGYPTDTTVRNSGQSTLNLSVIPAKHKDHRSTGRASSLAFAGAGCAPVSSERAHQQCKLCVSWMGPPHNQTTRFASAPAEQWRQWELTALLVRTDQHIMISQPLKQTALVCLWEKGKDSQFPLFAQVHYRCLCTAPKSVISTWIFIYLFLTRVHLWKASIHRASTF